MRNRLIGDHMKIINAADNFVKRVIGLQTIEGSIEYVENPYLVKDGDTIFNTLTREVIVLEDQKTDFPYLIRNWFYVPKGFDVSSLSHLIRQQLLNIENGPGSRLKDSYTIFTTTGCNASCSYCFEKGFDILTMSEKTAEDVADYIARTRNRSKPAHVEWFGGEPLCNKNVMTLISNRLRGYGIKVTSGITTNGSLLPSCTDEELKDIWGVNHVQLTFDGIENEYENVKGLPKGSFNKLLDTMERLDRLKILTYVRVHYDPKKGKDPCLNVIDTVSKFNNIRPYVRLLYDHGGIEHYKAVLELNDYIDSKGKYYHTLPSVIKIEHCIADSHKGVAITPEGKFSPCGHYVTGENIFGDIYNKTLDNDVLKKWAVKIKTIDADCKKCPLYPSCRRIVMCPAEGNCADGYRYFQIETIKRALRALRKERSSGRRN